MHVCWWCSEGLIWERDEDACEYLDDEEIEGVCSFLHCSGCNAKVVYTPSESRW